MSTLAGHGKLDAMPSREGSVQLSAAKLAAAAAAAASDWAGLPYEFRLLAATVGAAVWSAAQAADPPPSALTRITTPASAARASAVRLLSDPLSITLPPPLPAVSTQSERAQLAVSLLAALRSQLGEGDVSAAAAVAAAAKARNSTGSAVGSAQSAYNNNSVGSHTPYQGGKGGAPGSSLFRRHVHTEDLSTGGGGTSSMAVMGASTRHLTMGSTTPMLTPMAMSSNLRETLGIGQVCFACLSVAVKLCTFV
jgi:hypothetical protein